MQQRREWREKSGGEEVEEVKEANEVEEVTEDAGEIEVAEESASEDEWTACEVSAALGSG